MKPQLPDWTWQLEAGDMCKKHLSKPNGTHCLLGWLDHWLPCDYPPLKNDTQSDFVYKELRQSVNMDERSGMDCYNDSHTLDHNARVWNTTMKRLGYDIDEDRCL